MTELFLDVALVDFSGGGQARAKGMSGEFDGAFDLTEINANACGHCGPLHQPSNLLAVQPLRADSLPLPGHAAKKGAMGHLGELDPSLDCGDRAGRIGRAATDLDLSPSGFTEQRNNHTLVEDLDPTTTVLSLVGLQVEADDLGAPKAASKADEQHGPIPQAAQGAAIERFDHGNDILSHDRFLLDRWLGVAVADAGHHGGDMPVLAIEREATLGIVPGE